MGKEMEPRYTSAGWPSTPATPGGVAVAGTATVLRCRRTSSSVKSGMNSSERVSRSFSCNQPSARAAVTANSPSSGTSALPASPAQWGDIASHLA